MSAPCWSRCAVASPTGQRRLQKKHPWQAIAVVLSAIAHESGAPDSRRTPHAGAARTASSVLPIDDCSREHLLNPPSARRRLPLRQAALEGIAAAAAADAVLNTDEQAFVRASCSALGTHLVRTP